jgi:5,6-dimethylbenzimidazole synthase
VTNSAPDFDEAFRTRLHDLLRWRRDVRHFRPDPLPEGLLAALVEHAALAPSVGYAQPWRFVHVRDPRRRAAVVASFERANARALASYEGDDARLYASLKLSGLRDAPEHVAVFCDDATRRGKGLGRATMPEMLEYSAVMAIFAFWLAARAHGIGVGWVSIIEPDVVTRALDVPASWRLIAYLCVGYPADDCATPELERAGWESRDPEARTLSER